MIKQRSAARTKVMVVDDCFEHLDALADLLGEHGYEVRKASNGELALAQISEFNPDCILLDMNMPVMDGYELAQTLRTYLPQSILVGMSGATPSDPAGAGIVTLVDRWFQKPLDWQTLFAYLEGLPSMNETAVGAIYGASPVSSSANHRA